MEFTRVTNNLEGDLTLTYVYLWDLGPQKPETPKRPTFECKASEGTPTYDLAKLEFDEVLEEYRLALAAFKRGKEDYAKFQKDQGGPVELRFFSCDAADAMDRDPKRYVISSRTRGHEKRPNQGLPPGVKPGHGHRVNQERIAAGESDLEAARRRDPVFGQQEVRP